MSNHVYVFPEVWVAHETEYLRPVGDMFKCNIGVVCQSISESPVKLKVWIEVAGLSCHVAKSG